MAEQKTRGARRASKGGAAAVPRAAGETLRRTGSTAREATGAVAGAAPTEALEDVRDQGEDAAGGLLEKTTGGKKDRSQRDQPTVREELATIVREAAIEILAPVARNATRQAAKYAVKHGPQLVSQTIAPRVRETLGPAIEEAGGPGQLAKGTLSRVSQRRTGLLSKIGKGRKRGESSGEDWRVPVEKAVDVAVPLETAYEQFGQFEDFAKFFSGGEKVDERPNERIVWRSTDQAEASGVITFHRLSDRLTRVMVTYDSQPHSLAERATSALGLAERKLRTDLMRFKAFVEMRDEEETADGRGEREQRGARDEQDEEPSAREREEQPEEEYEDEQYEDEEYEEEDEEEPEAAAAGEEEPEAEAAGEEEPEEEEDEEPPRTPRVRRRAPTAPTRKRPPARKRPTARTRR